MNQDQLLKLLYTRTWGRMLLKPFVLPPFSLFMGYLMDSPLSRPLISRCIKSWNLPMEEYEPVTYQSYNRFFTRKIKPSARPFPSDPELLVSPCDGLAAAYPIRKFSRLLIKDTCYTLEDLFGSSSLAERYEGGTAVIIRLTVSNYHRYCYPVSGKKAVNRRIQGKFHTVNPIANDIYPIYRQNSREYTKISSPLYGDVIQMEVGALCVGRIVNYHQKAIITRGEEKGRFEFGGSTIVLFFQKGKASIRRDLLEASTSGEEIPILMGELLE